MKKIAVIDFETDPFFYGRPPNPFAAGFYDGTQSLTIWGDDCAARLVDFINDLEDDYIIYAHYGGKFDFHFLLNFIESDLKIINGRIAECRIGRQILRDSFLILPLALKQFGKTEIDYSKFERECRHLHILEIDNYLRDDCKYLFNWIKKFVARFGLGFTLAGTAFKTMKKEFGYNIEKTDNEYDSHFRGFYYGGRVECFKTGVIDGPLKYFDINSAYPYAMLSEHPQGSDFIEVKKLPKKAGGWFAEIDAISYGCLPYRAEKLMYYNDNITRKYYATGWEIIAGLETKTLKIIQIHNIYKHCFTRNFSEYILHFHAEKTRGKETGDKDIETFAKLIMNSSYGKFGQNSREFHDYKIRDYGSAEYDGFEWDCDFGEFELHKRKSNDDKDCEFYNVATAASVTGFVRAYLWRAICASNGPIYCDTDSLLCHDNGEPGNCPVDGLGAWRYELDVKRAYIGGRKFYLFECADGTYKQATKGFSATPDQLKKSIEKGAVIESRKDAPAYSIKHGARFITREIYADTVAGRFNRFIRISKKFIKYSRINGRFLLVFNFKGA